MEKQQIYLNRGQMELRNYAPNSKTVIGARRFGKTHGSQGPEFERDIRYMPRGAGALYQASFKQLLQKTLPETLTFLEKRGYKENVHFFVGRKAPDWMNFEMPFVSPRKDGWENAMHFFNGTVIHFFSQDVKFSANSITLDWLRCDEGRSLFKQKLFEEVVPAVSGAPGKFKDIPWHRGISIYSDMPTSKAGRWLLEERSKMTSEKNIRIKEVIDGLLLERASIMEKYATSFDIIPTIQRRLSNLDAELNQFRRHLFMYFEFDTIENLEVVGEDYIREQKRNLPPIVFYASIGNKLQMNSGDGFYSNFKEEIHCYDAYNSDYHLNMRTKRNTLDLKAISSSDDCRSDNDIISKDPLSIACDYNANINWIVTGQRTGNRMFTLSSMFTKHNQKIRQVIRNWCDYYEYHPTRRVTFYYTQQALDGCYADNEGQNFAQIVIEEFRKRKWHVTPIYMGAQWNQKKKHIAINDAFNGEPGMLFPMFNNRNNQFLIPSLQGACVKVGYKGFEKDKAGEKLKETEDDPLELRTDGTDAWDDLYRGLQYFPQDNSIYNISLATTMLR
jgi:hypothetical protein